MKTLVALACIGILAIGCKSRTDAAPAAAHQFSLPGVRHRIHTTVAMPVEAAPAPTPPPEIFSVVHYHAPLGDNVAYATPVKAGAKRPAIIWIIGGFDWGLDAESFQHGPRENDQSALALGEAGLIVMRPALRGSNGNPGHAECFLGEVDDILAAADYLATRPDVDPARIYVGGHSTGGTLALLAAESTDRFRAVIAFGPIDDPRRYGEPACVPADASDSEVAARAPITFLDQIVTPTYVLEGEGSGNSELFPLLKRHAGKAPIQFMVIPGADHFTECAPGAEVVAQAILADHDPAHLDITGAAIQARLSAAR